MVRDYPYGMADRAEKSSTPPPALLEANDFHREIDRLGHGLAVSELKLKRLETQLAGCATAAQGWISAEHLAKKSDYGWSAAYQDVVDLRRQWEGAEQELVGARAIISNLRERVKLTEAARDLAQADLTALRASVRPHEAPERPTYQVEYPGTALPRVFADQLWG